ncbi:hypothetical protein [Vibrio phage VCPH]|nr:hypothetical protein [Vibrio phage VCPH]
MLRLSDVLFGAAMALLFLAIAVKMSNLFVWGFFFGVISVFLEWASRK